MCVLVLFLFCSLVLSCNAATRDFQPLSERLTPRFELAPHRLSEEMWVRQDEAVARFLERLDKGWEKACELPVLDAYLSLRPDDGQAHFLVSFGNQYFVTSMDTISNISW